MHTRQSKNKNNKLWPANKTDHLCQPGAVTSDVRAFILNSTHRGYRAAKHPYQKRQTGKSCMSAALHH